jgi:hypothetical protein
VAADLAVSAVATPASLDVGGSTTLAVTVTDTNAGGATGIVLTVGVPAGLDVVSTYADRGSGCTGTTTLTCSLDFLSGTAPAAHVTIGLRASGAGSHAVTLAVKEVQTDPNAANNSASTTIAVNGPAAAAQQQAPAPTPLRLLTSTPLRVTYRGAIGTLSASVAAAAGRPVVVTGTVKTGAGKLLFLAKTRVGTIVSGRAHVTVVGRAAANGSVVLSLRLARRSLVRGRTYSLTATIPGGSPLRISFRA